MKIMMPDGSGNYLHMLKSYDVESIAIIHDLLVEQEIYAPDLHIIEDEKYYRLNLIIADINGEKYQFHSRKLNLNDLMYERRLLIE